MARSPVTGSRGSGHTSQDPLIIPELEALVGNVNYRHWTERDEDILRRYFGRVPVEDLAKFLGRSKQSVQNKGYRIDGGGGRRRSSDRSPSIGV